MSLKSDYNILRANSIEKELAEQGVRSTFRGRAQSIDGTYDSDIVVSHGAFYRVCDMLSRSRENLWQEQTKQLQAKEKQRQFRNIVLLVWALSLLTFCILIGNLVGHKKDLQADISSLEAHASKLETEVSVLNKKIEQKDNVNESLKNLYSEKCEEAKQLAARLNALEEDFYFYYDNAVFVTAAAGTKYHHFDCYYLDGRRYYIYNIELARAYGYTPCSYCFD